MEPRFGPSRASRVKLACSFPYKLGSLGLLTELWHGSGHKGRNVGSDKNQLSKDYFVVVQALIWKQNRLSLQVS